MALISRDQELDAIRVGVCATGWKMWGVEVYEAVIFDVPQGALRHSTSVTDLFQMLRESIKPQRE